MPWSTWQLRSKPNLMTSTPPSTTVRSHLSKCCGVTLSSTKETSLCVNNALPWSDFLQLPGRSRDSSPPHAVTNSPTSERGTWAETCSGPSEDPGATTTGKGGGVTTRPSSAPGSTFSPASTRPSSAMSAPNTFPRRTPHTSSSQSAGNPCRSPRPHRAFFWMTTSPASKRSVLTVRQQPDRITIPQIWSSRSPAFDRPRQSTLKYPAGVSNRPTVHHARRDPPPIHQPLHRLPTCWGGSIPITNLSRGFQIAIAPAAPPYVPLSAVPSLGGFRTPAAELAAPSIMRPASETLHNCDRPSLRSEATRYVNSRRFRPQVGCSTFDSRHADERGTRRWGPLPPVAPSMFVLRTAEAGPHAGW
jgi:hypothetical protein